MAPRSHTRRARARARMIAGASVQARTIAAALLVLAVATSGCGANRVDSATLAAKKAAAAKKSKQPSDMLVLNGHAIVDGKTGGPAWDNVPVANTTSSTTPPTPTTGATTSATAAAAGTTYLSDGTINDGTDPFLAMLRIPAVRPTWMLPSDTTPTPVEPKGQILDSWSVKSAPLGVVKVATITCAGMQSASGWVAAPEIVVTNAHVVAGSEIRPRVQVDGLGFRYPSEIVYVDRRNDIAILRVPGMTGATVLPMDPTPTVGEAGAIIGFPNGGDVHLDAAQLGVTQTDTVGQHDGWRQTTASRSNTYVSGFSEPGNSGGPVVNTDGQVMATLTGAMYETAPFLSVAVDNAAVTSAVQSAGSTPVDPGPCIAK